MSTDDKIVSMTFDARKFESGVNRTMSNVNKLNNSLKFPNAGKGFDDINKAAQKVDLSHISSGVEDIAHKLGAFHVAALAVFSSIAIRAVQTGAQMAKSFTVGPIIQGFQLYEQKINSVQTILANTRAAGVGLKDVNKTLAELNDYSNKTIYRFADMTRNLGTFTAAGVALKPATQAIKGIANLAALSGSNTDQAATAMYQLSQAIAAGQVHLQDWNSVVNAGMGGTVFQRALAQTAEAMGKLKKGSVELVGPMKNVKIAGESFRQSLQTKGGGPSWLTSDVLTNTLAQFTGDLSDAQLKAQGFNDAQIKAIKAQAKVALDAATQVKTFSQLMDVSKETIASGWANTWQIVFGNFGQAKVLFTTVSNVINNFANASAAARNKILKDWDALGGRTVLLESLKGAFNDLMGVFRPFQRAFRDIFPKQTGKSLFILTGQFKNLVDALRPSPTTMQNLRRTFRGLFAVLDIGKQIVSGIVTVFGELFKAAGAGDGGFLKFTASIGDFLVSIDKALKKGNAFHQFFVKMGVILSVPVKLLSRLAGAIGNLFRGFSPGGISVGINGMTKALTPFQKAMQIIVNLWHEFQKITKNVFNFFKPEIDQIAEAFTQLGPAISSAIQHMNTEAILAVIRTGLLAGIFLLFRNFLGGKGGLFNLNTKVTIFSLVFKNVGKTLDALTGSMQAMQTELKARTLKEIAIAIALLAVSVLALSFVDPKRLNSAITALTLLFVELLGAMKALTKMTSTVGAAKLAILAASLILIAGALDLLVLSVVALSRLSWESLKKGLSGITILLGEFVVLGGPLGKSAPGMIRAGIGMTAIAIALNILALAVRQMGSMDLKELAKGLGAIAISLNLIVDTMKLLSSESITAGIISTGIGLTAIGVGLNTIALAVRNFGNMDLRTIAQGLIGVGASIVIIAKSMALMPESNLLRIAASLLIVSIALQGIAFAVGQMGKMSMKEIAHGLGTLAGALVLLGGALKFMNSNIRGAAAFSVMAVGLALLVPTLILLGHQSWTTIIKGLTGLAGAMAIMIIASKFLDAVSLSLVGFGAALFLIGGAIALAGAGIFLFGAGLSAVAVSGAAAAAVMTKAITDFATSIPVLAKTIVLGALEIVKAFSETAPQFVDAMIKIIASLATAIIKSTPYLVKAFEVLLRGALKVIRDEGPSVIEAGFQLLLNLLKGLKKNIKQITVLAGDIIVNFLEGLAVKAKDIIKAGFDIIVAIIKGIGIGLARMVNAGAKALVKFLNSIADAITKYEPQILKAGVRIGVAIWKGMAIALKDGTGELLHRIKEMTKKMIDKLHLGWLIHSPSEISGGIGKNITQGLANGITKTQHVPVKAVTTMSKNMMIAAKGTFGITPSGTSAVMQQLGKDIVTSFAQGIRGSPSDIKQAFTDLNQALFDAASTARQNIQQENDNIKQQQDQLKNLLKHPQKNAKAIDEANKSIAKSQKIIRENQSVIDKATSGHIELTKAFQNEKAELIDLVKGYNSVSIKLDAANQALANAKQLRKQAFADYKDQYKQLPDISGVDTEQGAIDQVTAYENALKAQIEATKEFHKTLNKLRKLGLDDTTYKKLLADGTVDQQFADQLLAGGKSAVRDINSLDSKLTVQSTSLAKDAAANLYDAGVAAAQGLVDGLRSKKSELASSIEFLAKSMVHDIKHALGIKSPSTVFAEVGKYAAQGIAKGLIESSKAVTDAVYMVSDDAMGAMSKSLGDISGMISDNIDPNPTITPILDLSEVQKGAKSLGSILNGTPITAKASTSNAALIAGGATQTVSDTVPAVSGEAPSATFIQNNYSPESLSEIDIYRGSKNLFSQHIRRVRGV